MNKVQQKKKAKKANDNKLISIRIPEKMIQDLRDIAEEKQGIGYQQVIKAYIARGLAQESVAATKIKRLKTRKTELAESRDFSEPTFKARDRNNVADLIASDVISDDIQSLSRALKPYHRYFAGKSFLITGAFGFLGRYMVHLLKYLNENVLEEKARAFLLDNFVTGYEHGVISDEHLTFVKHDVIKPFHTDAHLDYIIHAAGIASPVYYTRFPIETMDVGTLGTRHMLELAYKKNVKSFLFTSSSEVYGDPDNAHVPTSEEYTGNVSITGPRSCYDESKRFGETMCLAYARVFNIPVKIVRPFNVYGPGIRPDDYRVLPNFIEHALRKEPLPIHGAGHNTRSFCYITDAIEAMFRVFFSNKNGEAFNIGNPSPEISVTELAHWVAKKMPYHVDVVHIDPPHQVYASSDPKRRCPDISKIQKLLGFKPKIGLEEGLERTIQWFSEF